MAVPSLAPGSDVLAPTDAIARAIARTDVEGARRAEELYGDDENRELAALAAGAHPFQRGLAPQALAASRRGAAEIVAVAS